MITDYRIMVVPQFEIQFIAVKVAQIATGKIEDDGKDRADNTLGAVLSQSF